MHRNCRAICFSGRVAEPLSFALGIPSFVIRALYSLFLFSFLLINMDRLRAQDISIDINGINITDVHQGHGSPYIIEFLFSLRDSNGRAVIVPPNQIRLSPFENGRALNSQESGAVVLPAVNKLLDTIVVTDFSASMSSLSSNADDNQNGISDTLEAMESTVTSFYQMMTEDVKSGLVEFHNGLSSPAIVEGLTDNSSSLINAINGVRTSVFDDFSGSTRFWDALDTGLSAMDSGASATDERYLFLFSDGADESSIANPLEVITKATDSGIRVFTMLYNQGELLNSDNGPIEFHVDSSEGSIFSIIKDSNGEAYKSGEARLSVSKEALSSVPAGDQFSFFGGTSGQVYILEPGENATEPVPSFKVSGTANEALQGGVVLISLVEFTGPGDFWLYTTGDNDDAFVYMNTLDGLSSADSFQINPENGLEPFMVFSENGDYELVFNVFSVLTDGSEVETKYKLLVTADEDVELIESGDFAAKFTYDGTAWNQMFLHNAEEIDPNDNFVQVGPESQRIITDPTEFPFFTGESLFVIDGSSVSLGIDLNEISQGFLVDENVTINLVDFSGDGELYAWASDPNNLSFDTSNNITSTTLPGGSLYPFQWAFSDPGEYSFGIQAVSQTIEPDEPTEGGIIRVTVRVEQDLNALLAFSTGGEIFTSKNSDQLLGQIGDVIYNLQGRYLARWSTLKRGNTPFIPSFNLQLQGQRASFEGPPVVPDLIDGSILDANLLWAAEQGLQGGTELTMQVNYVPRNFQGIRISYATIHDFELVRVPIDDGGLLPENWQITHAQENGVGTIEIRGPIVNGRPSVLPFSTAGRLFRLQFSEPVRLDSIFYEFEVGTINPVNSYVFPNLVEFYSPRTELLYETPIKWLNTYGIAGSIPSLVVAERSDLDGDGVPTWLEYRLGTNPVDGDSFFQLIGVTDIDGEPSLSFTTEKFIQYHILSSKDLESWELTHVLNGTGDVYHYIDVLPDENDHRFYQVEVVRPESISLAVELEYGAPDNPESWLAIKSHQGTYVTVGVDGKIATKLAESGEWEFIQSPTDKALWDVDFFQDRWFAVGNSGVVLQSDDDITWTAIETPEVPFLWSIANNGERIVAVGYRGGVITSDDGYLWTETNVSTPDFLRKVMWDGDRFIAVGAQGVLLWSLDGRRWNSINTNVNHALYDIAYSGSKYVVTGSEGTILVGENLNNLARSRVPISTDLYAVSWLDGSFVIGGADGTLLHSRLGQEWNIQFAIEGKPSPIWSFAPNQDETSIKAVGTEGAIQNISFTLD